MEYITLALIILMPIITIILVNNIIKKNTKQESIDLNHIINPLTRELSDQKVQIIKELGEQKAHLENRMANSNSSFTEYLNNFKDTVNNQINDQKKSIASELSEQKVHLEKAMKESDQAFMNNLNTFKDSINKQITEQMEAINRKVDMKLNEGFENTNKTFQNVLERLSQINEAQRQIEGLATNIVSLQDILTDKKARGSFGEVRLVHILASIFGEKNTAVFEEQKMLSTGDKVDVLLHAPEPMGKISIDSKFPLENYQRMIDQTLSKPEREAATKQFYKDVEAHIDAISSKYILPGETAEQAIMFLPAEAIFAEITAYHHKLLEYAHKKRVYITSPTTLMSTLTTIQVLLKNVERDKHAKIIQEHLGKLGNEFRLYKERWDKLGRSIETVTKTVKQINTTSNHITKAFNNIAKVELQDNADYRLVEEIEIETEFEDEDME